MKHDGYRILARKQGERVNLWSRHGTDFTDRLPRIAEAVRALLSDYAFIDSSELNQRPRKVIEDRRVAIGDADIT